MLKYPAISPVIFQVGPVVLRWYGLMYAVSFFTLISIMRRQARLGFLPLSERMVERLFILLVVFILAGARLFYILFYSNIFAGASSPPSIISSPLEALAIWHGGLSFHGGFAGILLASYVISRQAKVPWISIMDTLGLVGPIGLGLGRIGNFINGELYGRATNVPWAMIFPADPLHLPRHPSQLYECFCEGILLGTILWLMKRRVKRHGVIAASFMLGYAFFRSFCELFREPDAQLGFVLGPFTMGQLLSLGVLVPGILFLRYSLKHGPPITLRKKGRG
jgi:phosphatidylglycerol:prolipoprotein diacylglycerol transferase